MAYNLHPGRRRLDPSVDPPYDAIFMRTRALPACLAGLLLLLAAPGVTAGGESLTARWSLEGSDLALWNVFILPETEGGAEQPRPPDLHLSLFGYQVDRKGEARFPTHYIHDIAYDLALRVPPGKVREGQKVRMGIRYNHILHVRPMNVVIEGSVVEISGNTFKVQAKVTGGPARQIDEERFGGREWLTKVSGDLEVVFDCARGLMTAAAVRLSATLQPTELARKGNLPTPKDESHRYRFELLEVTRYEPGWKFDAVVGRAIARGTTWVRGQIEEDGAYGKFKEYPYGPTCLAALTLLVCGAERDDPFIVGLMDKVRGFQPRNTYEISIALMAMEAFHAPADEAAEVHAGKRPIPVRRKVAEKDLKWMKDLTDRLIWIAERQPQGWGWGYNREAPRVDLSNTQYAALGLLSAWRAGVKIPDDVWVGLSRGVMRHRTGWEKFPLHIQKEGDSGRRTTTGIRGKMADARGFSYLSWVKEPKSSMTCGGVSTLAIVRDVLRVDGSRRLRKGLGKQVDKAIEEGWAWLGGHWMIQRHAMDQGRSWLLYYLYSLERAGVLCRVKKINGRDWYFEGAAWLVGTQAADGHWQDVTAEVHDTCFALLFLKRATIPVPESTGAGK